MLVLGLTGGIDRLQENLHGLRFDEIHDSAAVLVRDGRVIAGVEQERLNRIKHTNKAPIDAIRACLELAGATAADLDAVAYYATEQYCDRVLEQLHLRSLSAPELFTGRSMVQRIVRDATGHQLDASRVRFIGHHWAHAVSAFYQSGFEDALVLSLDGQGEGVSGMVFAGRKGRLDHLRSMPETDSLGYLYRDVIRFIGYEMFDEYKVMGMAPYGDPARFRALVKTFYDLLPDGAYKLHLDRVPTLFRVVTPRRKGEAFTRTHQDLAAALQEALEEIALHVATYFARGTKLRRLCLAGGVAHNCSMNGRLLYSGLFDEIFVQPAAHDAGCALGAALAVELQERPGTRVAPLTDVYWGPELGTRETIAAALAPWADFIEVTEPVDVAAEAARLMADGKVLGWVQGRSEFGPRALGNRSIIADPRPAGHKDLINQMVKKREGYRPFAPSVLEDRAGEFFVMPATQKQLPFMSVIVEVRPQYREQLGAITHVDGTARIQTVSREQNRRYYELIEAFGRLTGVPIVLNTSFNNHAEPIVDSIEDAIVCFLTTGLDYLVAGSFLVSKRPESADACLDTVVALSPSVALRAGGDGTYQAAFTYHHGKSARIDETTFEVLRKVDGTRTLRQVLDAERITAPARDAVIDAVKELWSARLVRLSYQRNITPAVT